MTIGIYAISFSETDQVYIGQSINIERRWKEHLLSFKNNTCNYKLKKAPGTPSINILEICIASELSSREMYLIKEFDSICNGFNICDGGHTGRGTNHPSSKYTEDQLLEVLSLLVDDRVLNYSAIENITRVKTRTIQAISWGVQHTWLSEESPDNYTKLSDFKHKRLQKSAKDSSNIIANKITHPILVGPKGVEYIITNINEFARQYTLDPSALCKVLHKKVKSHKGYKLKPEENHNGN